MGSCWILLKLCVLTFLFCKLHKKILSILISRIYHTYLEPSNPHLVHEVPLHDVRVGMWCAVNIKQIIGPIFNMETINSDGYVTSLSAHLTGKFTYCFYEAILDPYRENHLALGSESCSFCQEPASDSCSQVYHCVQSTSLPYIYFIYLFVVYFMTLFQ
jgi:hypothetical protein